MYSVARIVSTAAGTPLSEAGGSEAVCEKNVAAGDFQAVFQAVYVEQQLGPLPNLAVQPPVQEPIESVVVVGDPQSTERSSLPAATPVLPEPLPLLSDHMQMVLLNLPEPPPLPESLPMVQSPFPVQLQAEKLPAASDFVVSGVSDHDVPSDAANNQKEALTTAPVSLPQPDFVQPLRVLKSEVPLFHEPSPAPVALAGIESFPASALENLTVNDSGTPETLDLSEQVPVFPAEVLEECISAADQCTQQTVQNSVLAPSAALKLSQIASASASDHNTPPGSSSALAWQPVLIESTSSGAGALTDSVEILEPEGTHESVLPQGETVKARAEELPQAFWGSGTTKVPESGLKIAQPLLLGSAVSSSDPQLLTGSLAEKIRLMRLVDRHELRLSLKPAELGKISLQLVQQEQQLKLCVFTETWVARDLLESHMAQLKQQLHQQGLHLQQVMVECNPDQAGGQFSSFHDSHQAPEQQSFPATRFRDDEFLNEELDLNMQIQPQLLEQLQDMRVNYLV